ncbi:MAG: LysM peptidoglycan-binding domain-containing protein [Anaerolineae bacterium]|nr:LysM peptidoglycan-binding domain-containing protein [Anaerolineae bacterium]MCI0610750.1 LysM peptidoglycan-binding domain-containing protein [Anaerolineae bacterium]
MKIRAILFIILFVLVLLLIGTTLPASDANAAPDAQFVTATPGPDGRILYTVVEGDNCSIVAFNHGITVPQLRQLNTRLDENCTLTVGQQIVVGLASSNAPTAGPAPTLPPATVTATPVSGTTEVCVLLFDDMNGDALRQETEFGIDGGAVSLTNLNGSYSQTQNTTSAIDPDLLEPIRSCFSNVPQGEYNVSMAVPDTYNPTMLLSYTLTVKAGDRASIDFGAQSKTLTVSESGDPEQGGRSSVLGIFGLLLLLSGAGLGYYAYRSSQPKSKLKGSPLTKR